MVRSSMVFTFPTPVLQAFFYLDIARFLHGNLHVQNLQISFVHAWFLNSGRANLHGRFFSRGTCARDDADDGKNFMNNQNNEVRVMRAARRRQSLTQLDLARLARCCAQTNTKYTFLTWTSLVPTVGATSGSTCALSKNIYSTRLPTPSCKLTGAFSTRQRIGPSCSR